MRKKFLITGTLVALAFELMADFPVDFQEAQKLFGANKNQEAREAFEKLAAMAPTPKSKAECLSYAAEALGRDKTQYDAAVEAAKKIGIKEISITTQMRIMQKNDKNKDLFETFKDEDFNGWTDIYQQQAYGMRGAAERYMGQYEAAKKDLIKAIEASGSDLQSKITALSHINNVYMQIKDYDNVVDTSKKIFELKQFKGQWTYLSAILICAKAQTAQGKLDDALETMKLTENLPDFKGGVYKCQALIVYGDIYAAQGKKEEAAASYKEAAEMKGPSYFPTQEAQKKLEALGKRVE